MASINVTIEVPELPEPVIDDTAIMAWIEARLNDARNLFIMRVSRGHGSGEIYRRGRRSQHRASSPGEFPVTDTGRLVNSVAYRLYGEREGALYTDVEYAKYLTEGTVHMAARSMLAEALTEVLEDRPREDVLARVATVE